MNQINRFEKVFLAARDTAYFRVGFRSNVGEGTIRSKAGLPPLPDTLFGRTQDEIDFIAVQLGNVVAIPLLLRENPMLGVEYTIRLLTH